VDWITWRTAVSSRYPAHVQDGPCVVVQLGRVIDLCSCVISIQSIKGLDVSPSYWGYTSNRSHSQVRVLCTHILNYANKADSAALSDVVFPAAEDEGGGNHDVQIEIVGYCTGTSRYLKQIAMSSRSGVLYATLFECESYSRPVVRESVQWKPVRAPHTNNGVKAGKAINYILWDFKFSRRRVRCSELSSGIINIMSSGMLEAVRTSETPVYNHFTRQYIPEDNSEQTTFCIGVTIVIYECMKVLCYVRHHVGTVTSQEMQTCGVCAWMW
jgi:hypothetical protein